MTLALDPRTTALLVMDMQSGILDRVASDKEKLLAQASRLLGVARSANVRVVYVVVGFRAGYPEVSPRNAGFAPIRASGRLILGTEDTAIHPSLAPRPDEVVVTKHRVSAFAGMKVADVEAALGGA